MKITYLANSASIHTVRWARHFAGRGHDVTVVSFTDQIIDGVRTIYLPAPGGGPRVNVFRALPAVRRLVRKNPPDILHAHYVTSYGLAGAVCFHHPFVVTAWGDDVLISPERSILYRLMVRWVLSRADLVTSMAAHMTNLMKRRGYSTPDNILTLPFGVDTDRFNPSYRQSSSGRNGITVISTRHLSTEYDVQTLIRAIPEILSRLPETRFMIVGKGELRSYLEQLAEEKGVRDCVDFLGEVDHHMLPHLLGKADIFVTTSISDGNNISLNEASACGAFPVVSDIPANREWIEEGKNGLFFPVGDSDQLAEKVILAAEKPEWRAQAAGKNWEIISNRGSWAKNMAVMEKMYEELFSGR